MREAIPRRGRWRLPVIGLCALAGTGVSLALPAVLGRVVDALGDRSLLFLAALLIAGGVAVDLLDVYLSAGFLADATASLRRGIVSHLLALPPSGTARFGTGDLVARVSGNAAEAAGAAPQIVGLIASAVPPLGSLVLLALIDVWLAAAFLVGVTAIVLVLRTYTRRTTEAVAGYQRVQGEIAGLLAESLTGARTIAAAGTADRERERVLGPLPELHRHGRLTWRVLSATGAKAAVAGPLALVAVLAVAGWALSRHRITPGELFAAAQYAAQGAGLGGLTGLLGGLARARAATGRVREVLDAPAFEHGDAVLPAAPGRLELRGATVTGVLTDVDLDLPGGSLTAVAGRSGSGKSTLAALCARLRDPDEGAVLLDGVPLPELTEDALRAAIGCAFERPVPVGATVAEAIACGRGIDVTAAARAADVHDWATRLPERYDTPLDEAPRSGGETQRLGLARAWPAGRLLVLDDAMSSVDTVTELRIGRALTRDHGGRTRLVVTHRAQTAARADRVVWLDDGRVRAVAPHAELWAEADYRAVFGS
ncbi:ABC transporter ATP-binding protein [Actinorhabdospora filicis]|uniref:ABC transporter ATP-binding protein n=1 Tax=Actinorhabdospora filicis TaxID=1785913 RepID=A0A9W6SLV4_9ACTN|nr:ABC transporter ATP-binding protein [Actinorhabdospora filicis]GLZ78633.1 ABC transporter ATP-binding protein [Actinorhabdospora filicis]